MTLFKSLFLGWLFFKLAVLPVWAASPSLYFSPANKTVMQNEQFNVDILVDTAGVDSGGVGAKISYDKAQLSIIKIEPGAIFADYPALIIDNENGRATISAISSSLDELFNGIGVLATIKFEAKKTGQAKVDFIFQPGSTIDSNIAVTFGNGDVLEAVNQLSLNVNQGSGSGQGGSNQGGGGTGGDEEEEVVQPEVGGIKGLINSLFKLVNLPEPFEVESGLNASRTAVIKVDPNKPITRQEPITDPSQIQSEPTDVAYVSEASRSRVKNWLLMPEVYLLLLALAVIGGWWWYWRHRNSSGN